MEACATRTGRPFATGGEPALDGRIGHETIRLLLNHDLKPWREKLVYREPEYIDKMETSWRSTNGASILLNR